MHLHCGILDMLQGSLLAVNHSQMYLIIIDVAVAQVAEKFKDEEAIYYPHNVDFRGRAYPMHPNLNHLGDDMCRALLLFRDSRPLGPEGLGWLYVQVRHVSLGRLCSLTFSGVSPWDLACRDPYKWRPHGICTLLLAT